jgi:hypothetical protein
METDAAFFTRRARDELLAASKAVHPRARQIHLDMAGRYADLARAIDPGALPEEDQVQAPERASVWF